MAKDSDEARFLPALSYRARRFWNAEEARPTGRALTRTKPKRSVTELWTAGWRKECQVRERN